jgi:alkylated DNA repair dioxygenase AlkB
MIKNAAPYGGDADERNLLPYDGDAVYFGRKVSEDAAETFFLAFSNAVLWQHDEVVIFGKRYKMMRRTGWYGDGRFVYRYSGVSKIALPWTPELLELKNLTEQITGETFNCCLLNLYDDGTQAMGWHADDEPQIKTGAAIASWSFGAERKFSFRHRQTKETVSLVLENGSLLVMKGDTQRFWLHALPKSAKVKTPRINLTFRTFVK